MTYITTVPPSFFSHADDFEVSKDVLDDFSRFKYDSEGRATLLRHEVAFTGFYHRNEVFSNDIACGLFTYTFQRHVKKWCHTFPTASIHSYDHMLDELFHAFYHYDVKHSRKNSAIKEIT